MQSFLSFYFLITFINIKLFIGVKIWMATGSISSLPYVCSDGKYIPNYGMYLRNENKTKQKGIQTQLENWFFFIFTLGVWLLTIIVLYKHCIIQASP